VRVEITRVEQSLCHALRRDPPRRTGRHQKQLVIDFPCLLLRRRRRCKFKDSLTESAMNIIFTLKNDHVLFKTSSYSHFPIDSCPLQKDSQRIPGIFPTPPRSYEMSYEKDVRFTTLGNTEPEKGEEQ
jgi:hypothetical protein